MPTRDPYITADIVCHSVNQFGNELITMVINYPRIILAEFNTHRMFSRSTASSRAIPVLKQIEKIKSNPFIPSWIGKNQSGMQANEELTGQDKEDFLWAWIKMAGISADATKAFSDKGLHKQIANRIIEPWQYVKTIVTATDWDNFFHLRCNKDAQPEMMLLAYRMLEAKMNSEPVETKLHLPFGERMAPGISEQNKIKIACARCARISYESFDGDSSHEADMALADKLAKAGHMSPFEHVATPNPHGDYYVGNFRGWVQHRKKLNKECIQKVNYEKLMNEKPDWV